MKKSKIIGIALLAILITAAGFYSCEKTDVAPVASSVALESPKLVLAPALWVVTSFQWQNKAQNDHFVEYTFHLNADGTVIAYHNNLTDMGTWSKNDNLLKLGFNDAPLNELNNIWTIIEHSKNNIQLKALNLTNGSTEFLVFEKRGNDMPA